MYKTIVLAYDGSQAGQRALLDSEELAQWSAATLWLVAVRPNVVNMMLESGIFDPAIEAIDKARFEALLSDGLKQLASHGHSAKGQLLSGEPVHEISRFAQEANADLIIVGHKHRNSWAARWWSGSISGSLVEHAPCSVLCVIAK